MAIFLSQEIVSDEDRMLLVGVQTEDVSVQRLWDTVSRRAK
ncbi:hypothetical protein [Nostoc sp.]